MKVYLLFIFSLFFLAPRAQVVDGFDDGDFVINPSWSGDSGDFNVNVDGRLQLNALSGGDSFLSLPVNSASLDSMEWKFRISLDFSPSSSNYAKVYLVTDTNDLNLPLNGYFVRFGESLSNDAIELFRQDGTTTTSICRGTDGVISNPFDISVRICRTINGDWTLFADYSGGSNFSIDATGNDATYNAGKYFGISCTYTNGNIDRFFFDDFYIGPILPDTIRPSVNDFEVISDSVIRITFSEMMELNVTSVLNYSIDNGIGNPYLISVDTSAINSYLIYIGNHLQPQSNYLLSFSNLKDVAGNPLSENDFTFQYSLPAVAVKGDIIFSEIYFEPSESSPLPYSEYVEIYNRKDSDVFITGWTISDGSSDGIIPEFRIPARSYAVLCSDDDIQLFNSIQNAIPVSGFPSLNNDVGDQLILSNENGEVIDELKFSNTNYHDSNKDDGGWSIERIDCDFFCGNDNNWHASTASMHGTPGIVNSVIGTYTDEVRPYVLNAYITDSNEVEIIMSEAVSQGADNFSNYFLTLTDGININPQGVNVSESMDTIYLIFSSALSNTTYTVHISEGVKDCPGNSVSTIHDTRIGFSSAAEPEDILINEILFYCNSGSADYLELFNASGKIIDIQNWVIAEADFADSNYIREDAEITKGHRLFFPGEYLLLTEDENLVKSNYFCEDPFAFLNVASMPDFNSDEGRAILFDQSGNVIDAMRYNDDMHFPLLSETRGVSLERLSVNEKNDKENNWHSAAGTAGYGTPGFRNSQSGVDIGGVGISVGEVFSPDNDGFDDVLTVHYSFPQPGTVLSLNVFDYDGRPVRTLLEGETVASDGDIVWNGLTDDRAIANTGIYVLIARSFELGKSEKVIRKAVYLTKQF